MDNFINLGLLQEVLIALQGMRDDVIRTFEVLAGLASAVPFNLFWYLFVFRYLRLIVHFVSFWCFYKVTPVPVNPTIYRHDCSIILPTIDPTNADFRECINSCLSNSPGEIIIITVGLELATLTEEIVAPYRTAFPGTDIQVRFTNIANKRLQVAHGVGFAQGKVTILLDDHVFWPSFNFLPTILAPFEDDRVGAVGTNKRVRRTDTGFNLRSFWNMIGALYLERHNFEIRATNAIDGGVFVISGRTAAYRTSILKSPGFMTDFTNERFFFGIFGPLNADDDNFLTRQVVARGFNIKIQYCEDAMIETTLGTYPKFLSQALRWVRTTWRSNSASLFTDRTVWFRQPWCVYAVYLTSFVNFALFYDAALIYTLSIQAGRSAVYVLIAWIFITKMVKLTSYFLREPQDLLMLPGYFAFAYFHSLIKLYAGLTFWVTAWGGRNLDAINSGNTFTNDDDDDNSVDDNNEADDDDGLSSNHGNSRNNSMSSSSNRSQSSSSSGSNGPPRPGPIMPRTVSPPKAQGWVQTPWGFVKDPNMDAHIRPTKARPNYFSRVSGPPANVLEAQLVPTPPSSKSTRVSSSTSSAASALSSTIGAGFPFRHSSQSPVSPISSQSTSIYPSPTPSSAPSAFDYDTEIPLHPLPRPWSPPPPIHNFPTPPPSRPSTPNPLTTTINPSPSPNTIFSFRTRRTSSLIPGPPTPFPAPPQTRPVALPTRLGIPSGPQLHSTTLSYSTANAYTRGMLRDRRTLDIPESPRPYNKSWFRSKECQCLHSDRDGIYKTRSCRCLVEDPFVVGANKLDC